MSNDEMFHDDEILDLLLNEVNFTRLFPSAAFKTRR